MKRADQKRRAPAGAFAGLTPPANVEAEQSVLGAMLISREAVDVVTGESGLTPDHFSRAGHSLIFETILAMQEANTPVDLVTISHELRRHDQLEAVGGQVYLMTLMDKVPSAANASWYASTVKDEATRRRALDAGVQIALTACDRDLEVFEVVAGAEAAVYDVTDRSQSREGATPARLGIQKVLDAAEFAALNGGQQGFTGMAVGFPEIDAQTGGLEPGTMTVIAGRTSMGKTSLALAIAVQVAKRGDPVLVFSLEMDRDQIFRRLLSAEAEVGYHAIGSGQMTQAEAARVAAAAATLQALPLAVDDNREHTVPSMRAECRRFTREHGKLALVVVDYLQLVGVDKRIENRQLEVQYLSKALRASAQAFDCPFLVLAQLSRALESRQDKRPMLSDLRESGAIENDADGVWFVYRERYYAIQQAAGTDAPDDTDAPDEEVEVILGKNRNKARVMVKTAFRPRFSKFFPMPPGGILGAGLAPFGAGLAPLGATLGTQAPPAATAARNGHGHRAGASAPMPTGF